MMPAPGSCRALKWARKQGPEQRLCKSELAAHCAESWDIVWELNWMLMLSTVCLKHVTRIAAFDLDGGLPCTCACCAIHRSASSVDPGLLRWGTSL
jgi:hypothetical protein